MFLIARPIANNTIQCNGANPDTLHWMNVDEETADGDASYIFHTSETGDSAYDFYDKSETVLSGSDKVLSIIVQVYAKNPVDQYGLVAIGLKSGETISFLNTFDPGASYALHSATWSTDPATGNSWTLESAENCAIGFKLIGEWSEIVEAYLYSIVTQVYAQLDFIKVLSEELKLEEIKKFSSTKILKQQIDLTDKVIKRVERKIPHVFQLQDQFEIYKAKKHQTFEVIIYRNGSPLEISKEKVLEFEFSKVLSEEIGGGNLLFDNSDLLDIKEGDQIEIKWQSEAATVPLRVFTGEIDQVQQTWNEEEARQELTIQFQDWGKLLLERKITKSYPLVTNVNSIIDEILASVSTSNNPPYIQERKIFLADQTLNKTRTVDFIGESLWDCLKKLAFITESEFFVDKDKRLQFFSRPTTNPISTLEMSEILDYTYETRDDIVMNTVQVYGHQNKPEPWDYDSWTENTLSWTGLYGSTLSAVSNPPPKLGDYLIKIPISGSAPEEESWYSRFENYSFEQCWPGQGMNIIFSICPPQGKYVEFNRGHVCHSGSTAGCQMAYQWGTTQGAWINFGARVQGECAWREVGPISGATNQILYIRWQTDPPPFSTCCTISAFGMEYRFRPFSPTEEKFGARLALSTPIDLSKEESYKELVFNLLASLGDYSFGGSLPLFQISLHYTDGDSSVYQAQFQGLPMFGWTEIRIPLGETAEGWDNPPSKKVQYIDFDFTVTTNSWVGTDFLGIDALRFDSGKWYGVWSDTDSMQSPPSGCGTRYKKLFDDTLYSDVAAQRWARSHVERFAYPINFLLDVNTVANGIEYLEPGAIIAIGIPETPNKRYYYRLLKLRFKYSEEEFLETILDLERTDNWEVLCVDWDIETILSSTQSTTSMHSSIGPAFFRRGAYVHNKFWFFYIKEAGATDKFGYETINEVGNLSGFTELSNCANHGYVTTYFDGQYIHYAIQATEGGAIYYRRGLLNADNSITWSTDEQLVVSAGAELGGICVSTTGYPFISFLNPKGFGIPRISKSSTNDGTWSTEWTYNLAEVSDWYMICPLPLTNGKVGVVVLRGPPDTEFYCKIWDGENWSQENIPSSFTPGAFDAASKDDSIYTIYRDLNDATRLGVTRRIGQTETWQNLGLVVDRTYETAFEITAIQGLPGDNFVIWYACNTSNTFWQIFYKIWNCYTGGWKDEEMITIGVTGNTLSLKIFNDSISDKIGVIYRKSTSGYNAVYMELEVAH